MSQSTALNPTLYRRLLLRFGEPKVRNEGQKRVVTTRHDADGTVTHITRQWGEQYMVRCPFCRSETPQLAVSYMYGQPDDVGRPMFHLAHCFNRNCLRVPDNRRELAEKLGAGQGQLEDARTRPGRILTEVERIPDLPEPRTPIDELPRNHPARRWLKRQGFDPDKVGKAYGLSVCLDADDPLTRHRIIIPVTMRGKHQGWQSLATGETARTKKYLSAPGMRTSELVYNLDAAREYRTPVIVQEPADVWAFGRMATCPLGETVSRKQVRILRTALHRKHAVLLLRSEGRDLGGTQHLREEMERALAPSLLVVEYGDDIPQGRAGRAALRELVLREAEKAGFQADFRKKE